jgi:TonB family protein
MVIPTIEERAMIINQRIPPDDGRGGTEYGVIDEPIDHIPPPDSFVAMEIYPEMIHHVTPDYPRFAREAGLEGVVHVHALVMPDGRVREAVIYHSSGVKSLDEAALNVAKRNVYKPGIQNGRPVACWVVYKVVFELSQ